MTHQQVNHVLMVERGREAVMCDTFHCKIISYTNTQQSIHRVTGFHLQNQNPWPTSTGHGYKNGHNLITEVFKEKTID
jgi:hypothetical protein